MRPKCSLIGATALLIAVVLLNSGSMAFAQQALERQCLTEGNLAQIQTCSALIDAGRGNLFAYHVSRGSALLAKQDCDGALADFDAAVRLRPNDSNSQGGRGLVFYSCKHDYRQAVAAFSEVIRLSPRDAAAYDIRATARKFIGDLDGAIADDTIAIRLAPKFGMYYGNRAITWTEKGDASRALADFNRDVEIEPTVASVYNNRGHFFLERHDNDQAIADFTEAIHLNPRYPKAYANRSDAWRLKGDLDRSVADADQAIALDPTDPLNYVRRADTLRYRGDYTQSLTEYDRALAIMPDYIPAFTGRGLSYERLGDLAAAKREFEKALASQSYLAHLDYSKSSLETARARIAALDSGAPLPVILPAPRKAESATSIPTPAVTASVVPPSVARATSASQGRRIALVIGNSAYRSVVRLNNPQNDARAIGASLQNIGFDGVTIVVDATGDGLREALKSFAGDARNADWAMIYYAGHGVDLRGVDYLIPIDAKIAAEGDAVAQGIPLAEVTAAIEGARKLKLVMLDACRDNPFENQASAPAAPDRVAAAAASATGARSLSQNLGKDRGLAPIRIDHSTLVFFAAKEGQAALDGDGNDSPFAVAMIQRLATPGVEINTLFRLVRDDVMEATAGRQEPYVYGSLPEREQFYFVAGR
ncbi:MAG: caspase family protein [Bradyrhizobium sp.]|uniref:caspase family protein n=1 Tax=Bradyrhizobium sp. TaxID=376 RepID=UPI001C297CD5|nr:caspase family protein [Bradyrhizobium sp.]MBU6461155.1 caspase family protein [Pseudomonadota bacterium]MDE2066231.1 caspase family protein [Bradyrhizobium sp.]MDE2243331.1 caspase family protein [Bradyrhizobium sp.]MDE2470363.1 caspase family protein [Bradyrhizobium sp.]